MYESVNEFIGLCVSLFVVVTIVENVFDSFLGKMYKDIFHIGNTLIALLFAYILTRGVVYKNGKTNSRSRR